MKKTKISSPQTPPKPTALLLGAGYCARALIPDLIKAGYEVIATTRDTSAFPVLTELGATPLLFELNEADKALTQAVENAFYQASVLLISLAPRGGREILAPHLSALHTKKKANRLKWAGYLSATSVYGDQKGGWVDEEALLYPTTQRGKARMRAELAWLETGLPIHIFRLAGIYGPKIGGIERNPFGRIKQGKARAVIKPGHLVNRIEVRDIARALMLSIKSPDPLMIYNLSDGNPAPPQTVLDFAAALIKAPFPKRVDYEVAQISDMARSFYTETKCVTNDLAKTRLGWQPRFPNYLLGLMSIIKLEMPKAVFLGGHIDIPSADLPAVKRGLSTHIRLSRQEPDCQRFELWQDPDKPSRFHVFEIFTHEQAFRRHQARMKNSEWALITQNAKRHYHILGANSDVNSAL